jgi:hypothetical protein
MISAQQSLATRASDSESLPDAVGFLQSAGQRLAAYASACADYWSAATAYEDLRRLSDAELHRRGLSRGSLGRDVFAAYDRGMGG